LLPVVASKITFDGLDLKIMLLTRP